LRNDFSNFFGSNAGTYRTKHGLTATLWIRFTVKNLFDFARNYRAFSGSVRKLESFFEFGTFVRYPKRFSAEDRFVKTAIFLECSNVLKTRKIIKE
jgi:hypothetical protein